MKRSPSKGFTLIELMMVVAIIGLLAAIAIPKFGNLVLRAREARVMGQMGTLRSALMIYYADNEGHFPGNLGSLRGRYINSDILELDIPRFATHPHDNPSPGTDFSLATYSSTGVFWPLANVDYGGWGIRFRTFSGSWPYTNVHLFVNCTHTDSRGRIWTRY